MPWAQAFRPRLNLSRALLALGILWITHSEVTALGQKPSLHNLPKNLIPVPWVRQKTSYSCGPAATLALLQYWNYAKYRDVSEQSLYAPLRTTEQNGTDPQPMANRLNQEHSLRATYVYDTPRKSVQLAELLAAVNRGEPPIVDLQAWQQRGPGKPPIPWSLNWEDGHYAILIGYDAVNLYFMDPSTDKRYAYIPRAEFASRWHDVDEDLRRTHMVIFVHSTNRPYKPTLPPQKDVPYME